MYEVQKYTADQYVKQLQSPKADQYKHMDELHNESQHTTNNTIIVYDTSNVCKPMADQGSPVAINCELV